MSNAAEKTEGVKVVRLSTGELLIGEMFVRPNTPETIIMRNVGQLVELPPNPQQPDQQGQLAMVPFLPFTSAVEETELVFANVVVLLNPVPQVLENWQKQFGKVITPTQQILQPE